MNICDHNTFPEVILLDVTETFLYIELQAKTDFYGLLFTIDIAVFASFVSQALTTVFLPLTS